MSRSTGWHSRAEWARISGVRMSIGVIGLLLVAPLAGAAPPTGDLFDELEGPAKKKQKALMGELSNRSEALTFVDAETGEPVEGVKVELQHLHPKTGRVTTFTAFTGRDGRAYIPWRILTEAEQRFCLSAHRIGYDRIRRMVASEAGMFGVAEKARFLISSAGEREPVVEPCALDIAEKLDRAKARLTVQVHFPFAEHELTEKGRQQAAEIGAAIAAVCEKAPEARFLLRGHTDLRGSEEANRALSLRRAEAVAEAVRARHDDLACPIDVEGAGEEEPVDPSESEQAHARNRRVEVVRR